MQNKKVLLYGCGQLGSRHLQALATTSGIAAIHVVDVSEASLDLGKKRLDELGDKRVVENVTWSQGPHANAGDGDLCLVATLAKVRGDIVKQACREWGYRRFLVEKVVAQSLEQYNRLLDFTDQNELLVWVNCQLRTFEIYKYIKAQINPDSPITFTRVGGNKGLATNGVHSADLFLHFDGSDKVNLQSDRIDPLLHKSKRGATEFDLSGDLFGYSDKGSSFILSFAAHSDSPAHISVMSSKCKFIVSHAQNWAFECREETGWRWEPIPIKNNMLVSQTTRKIASDILQQDTCELPTLRACLPAHAYIFEALLPHFRKLTGEVINHCPIT